MSVSKSGYQLTIERMFGKLDLEPPESEGFHKKRSEVFNYLRAVHSLEHRFSQMPNDDQCISVAERIVKNRIFMHHPASHTRVLPIAETYIKEFLSLRDSGPYDKSGMQDRLETLLKTHEAFVNAYNEEVKFVFKKESQVVKVTQKSDIDFFVKAFVDLYSGSSLEKLTELHEKVVCRDNEFVYLFPRIVLERVLQLKAKYVPQLFSSSKREIEALAESYHLLSLEEQDEIHQKLTDGNPSISDKAKAVYDKLTCIAANCQAADQALYASMLSCVYTDLEKCLGLAVQIKKVLTQSNEDLSDFSIHEVILFCSIASECSASEFSFFKLKEIVNLRKEYQQVDRKNLDGLLKDLKYYSSKLAFDKEFSLIGLSYRIARN